MNPQALRVLEYSKILERLAAHCAFSAGAEIARSLLPSDDLRTVQDWLAQTAEAYRLLAQKTDIHFGGATDVRPLAEKAERGASLFPQELLDIKLTLLRASVLKRTLMRLSATFPHLADMASIIEPCEHVITEISRCISDRADVLDNASSELGSIRSQLRVAQDRLLSTLERLVQSDSMRKYLQEPIVTQRQGRYVVPVRAEYKGYVDGIVHDQSASGATLFVEPLKVVTQNNAVRQLTLEEEKEIRRILAELSNLVGDEAVYIRRNVQALAQLDFTFAKARYAFELEASAPQVVPFPPQRPVKIPKAVQSSKKNGKEGADPQPLLQHPGSVIDLRRARHPMLNPATVVPIDVYLGDSEAIVQASNEADAEPYYLLVVTGPNTGGKTVTLKTVGLLILMAQSGMMIPTDPGSKLSLFSGIYADIGDEQSIEQNLSTFSSHMTRIINILEEADPQSLVLFDELGAGTDPDEGSALAMALLENLRDRGITTLATTHYSDLKLYAHSTPGVRNASVEFDVESLSPTYELSIGLPGRSNALTIARRLGLNPTIVEAAEGIVRPDALQAESLLDDIKRTRQEGLRIEERTRDRERQVQLIETDLRHQLAEIETVRRRVIAETRETMQTELAEARREIEQARKRLGQFGSEGFSGNAHDDFLSRAQAELTRREAAISGQVNQDVIVPGQEAARLAGPIEVGDRVWIPSLHASGEVLNAGASETEVVIGTFRLKLPTQRLELRQKAVRQTETVSVSHSGQKRRPLGQGPGMELDLRGHRVEEGLTKLERYMDDAYLTQLPWVRIIHGKGTGAMRDAVRLRLRDHPLVSQFRPGDAGEGGDGVTVAKFVGE